ncbi:MAG: hypothetical protein ACPLVG_04200 [Pseudothermotoga sp.]
MIQRSRCFNILLKMSFFKNELYKVSFDENKMIFKCLEQSNKDFALPLDDIRSISLYGNPARELEIRTNSQVIIGNFKSTKTSNHAVSMLKEIFQEKLIFIN